MQKLCMQTADLGTISTRGNITAIPTEFDPCKAVKKGDRGRDSAGSHTAKIKGMPLYWHSTGGQPWATPSSSMDRARAAANAGDRRPGKAAGESLGGSMQGGQHHGKELWGKK